MSQEKNFTFRGQPRRLDKFLAESLPEISRTYIQRLIKGKDVTVDGKIAPSNFILTGGEKILLRMEEFSGLPPSATEDVPILFEDENIIVLNKPAGVVVHPAGPHQKNTLIQKLWPKLSAAWASSVKGRAPSAARPGVVHRLDRGTSGVMVIAKTPAAAENLSRQFADRTIQKIYLAFVHGVPSTKTGRVRSMVGRSRNAPHRMSVEDQGRWSETEFTVLKRFPHAKPDGAALLEVHPLTGRTHQIRVQMASLGHPLVGDVVYGGKDDGAARPLSKSPGTEGGPKGRRPPRPLLHAFSLEIRHPASRKKMKWTVPPPEDFSAFENIVG